MEGIKPPELEAFVGMEVYSSKTPGVGGVIKKLPEDFMVEEIMEDGTVLEIGRDLGLPVGEKKEYLHFTLEKTNWDTMRALKVLSGRLRVGRKRFGFAGTKDKKAVSTQRVAAWNITAEDLAKVNIRDIVLRDPVYSDERINLGCLQGNRFTLAIRGVEGEEVGDRITAILDELGSRVPNFFGLQRFGATRPITHQVGREILKRNFESAVMIYLAEVFEEESEDSRDARKALAESGDFKAAARDFPRHLGYEKSMIDHLVKTPTDYIGALRELPKKLRWMFVHAYQGYVFNLALSEYIRRDEVPGSLPLPGYEIGLDEVSARILEEKGLRQEDFKVSEMPEMSSEGLMRETYMEVEDPEFLSIEPDDLIEGASKARLRFSLSKGSYATSVIREIMKNEYWRSR